MQAKIWESGMNGTEGAAEMWERVKYWIFQKGKNCKRCCIRCEYYDLCRREVSGKEEQRKERWKREKF